MKKLLKNSDGVSFVLFTLMLGASLLGLLGAVFGGLYNAQVNAQKMRAGANAMIMMQQLGAVTLQAYQTRASTPAPAPCEIDAITGDQTFNTDKGFGGADIFCFPLSLCIPHPRSGDAGDEMCDQGGVNYQTQFGRLPVLPGTDFSNLDFNLMPKESGLKHYKNIAQELLIDLHKYLFKKVNYLSDVAHAEIIIPVDFTSVGAPAVRALNSACGGTLCKTCSQAPTNPGVAPFDELPCMRFRVCPKYGGCNPANNDEWVVHKVGVLIGPPSF